MNLKTLISDNSTHRDRLFSNYGNLLGFYCSTRQRYQLLIMILKLDALTKHINELFSLPLILFLSISTKKKKCFVVVVLSSGNLFFFFCYNFVIYKYVKYINFVVVVISFFFSQFDLRNFDVAVSFLFYLFSFSLSLSLARFACVSIFHWDFHFQLKRSKFHICHTLTLCLFLSLWFIRSISHSVFFSELDLDFCTTPNKNVFFSVFSLVFQFDLFLILFSCVSVTGCCQFSIYFFFLFTIPTSKCVFFFRFFLMYFVHSDSITHFSFVLFLFTVFLIFIFPLFLLLFFSLFCVKLCFRTLNIYFAIEFFYLLFSVLFSVEFFSFVQFSYSVF